MMATDGFGFECGVTFRPEFRIEGGTGSKKMRPRIIFHVHPSPDRVEMKSDSGGAT